MGGSAAGLGICGLAGRLRPDLTGKEAVVEISMYSLGWEGTGLKSRVGTKMLMKKNEDDEDSDESSSAQPLAEEEWMTAIYG